MSGQFEDRIEWVVFQPGTPGPGRNGAPVPDNMRSIVAKIPGQPPYLANVVTHSPPGAEAEPIFSIWPLLAAVQADYLRILRTTN